MKHWITNRNVAGSNPDGASGFFTDLILPVFPHFLESKGGRCVGLTTFMC